MFSVWLLALGLLVRLVEATSHARTQPLRHVSKVVSSKFLDHSISEFDQRALGISPDPLSFELDIPADGHLSNLQRRWWAQADPNGAQLLADQFWPSDTTNSDSLALYSFLTQNASLEVPESTLNFRFVMRPVEDQVVPDGIDGTVVHYEGKAYRKMVTVRDGRDSIKFKPVGWARMLLLTYPDGQRHVQGSWLVDDERGLGVPSSVYHLTTAEQLSPALDDFERDAHLSLTAPTDLVVWRDFDIRENAPFAHMSDYAPDDYSYLRKMNDCGDMACPGGLFKRDGSSSGSSNDTTSGYSSGVNLASTVGNSTGCPTRRQVALVGMAADCNFLSAFNSTQTVRLYLMDIVSRASRLYEESFNITLGLREIYLTNDTECSTSNPDEPWNYQCNQNSTALSDRLGAITQWRSNRSADGMATWTLMTQCSPGGVVGLSWEGMVCQSGSGAGGTNVVHHTVLDYRVLAHEIGHSFGAVHDCTSDTCSQGLDRTSQCCPLSSDTCNAGGSYIMNPSSSDSQDRFSDCTQGNVCGAIGRRSLNTTCLLSNSGGVDLVSPNVCGNGIVEDGEECDCGGEDGCRGNTCCDPTTCRFTSGSQCDDSNDECCTGCRYAGSDTVCRASTGPCDPAEYCPGNSTSCPTDRVVENGQSCTLPGNGTNLQCISGHCTSRDLQCVTLMANNTLTSDGRALDMVRACPDDSSCQLSCVDSSYGSSTCFTTNQNFLDGTPCRGSGRCRQGRCVGGSSNNNPFTGGNNGDNNDDRTGFWYWRYVVIGVAVAIGVLVGFLFLCSSCCSSGRRQPVKASPAYLPQSSMNHNYAYGPPPPQYGYGAPPPRQQGGGYLNNFSPPPPPPPARSRDPWGYADR